MEGEGGKGAELCRALLAHLTSATGCASALGGVLHGTFFTPTEAGLHLPASQTQQANEKKERDTEVEKLGERD